MTVDQAGHDQLAPAIDLAPSGIERQVEGGSDRGDLRALHQDIRAVELAIPARPR